MIDFQPLGDRAFLVRFPGETEAQEWAWMVRARTIPGLIDVVAAYTSTAVYFDPDRLNPGNLVEILDEINPGDGSIPPSRLIHIPVLYDGEDLAEVSRLTHLTQAEVMEHHASVDYQVFAIGFVPGFPYLGYLRGPLSGLPRRSSPRLRVPGGSVAIAGRQTGIYPREAPGGWSLLGRTPLVIVDLEHGFFPIQAGDLVRFDSIGPEEYRSRLGEPVDLAN